METLNDWTIITLFWLIEEGLNKSNKREGFFEQESEHFKIQNKIKFSNLVKMTKAKTIL